MQKWVALSEGQGGSIGWLTVCQRFHAPTQPPYPVLTAVLVQSQTNERKEAMVFQLRDALSVGNISLSDQFFSVCMDEHEAIKAIRDELCRFAIITEPAKTLFGKVRRTYTGKIGGQQDDLAICLQLAITGLRCFYQSAKYSNFRQEL